MNNQFWSQRFFAPHRLIGDGPIGRGGFCDVWKVQLHTGQFAAAKFLRENTPRNLADFRREVQFLEGLRNEEYIVNILGKNLYAPMPYYYMELCDYIGKLTSEQNCDVLWSLVQAVKAVHRRGWRHRDIKPPNALMRLVKGGMMPILNDFGIARGPLGSTGRPCNGTGTPAYTPPEVLAGREFTQAGDIYSLGITMFELFTGNATRPTATLSVSGKLLPLLGQMTHEDPRERPNIYQVEQQVALAINLRKSPVQNWLANLTGGQFLVGVGAAIGIAAIFAGSDE
jgi:serine/threonine protein kinase